MELIKMPVMPPSSPRKMGTAKLRMTMAVSYTHLDVYKRQGHGWVKARFITPAPPGTPIVEQFPVRMPDGTEKVLERARVFIPSSVFDNPALLENDPD